MGILAHVDAGKTTLTERLLHLAGVIDEPGSVDVGTTRTDTLALERRRGITIKAAVVSFPLEGTTVNVVDTPGHPDFIAEVERVLGVLDGAILVLSAVEGVEPQTRILMRALQRFKVPTLLFVNKVDRNGADLDLVLTAIRRRLTADILPMGSITGAGSRAASYDGSGPTTTTSGSERPPRWPNTTTPILRRSSKGAPSRPPGCGRRSPPRPAPACCTRSSPGRRPPVPASPS